MENKKTSSLFKLWSFMAEYKARIILVVVLAVSSTSFGIVGPKLIGNITTEVFKGAANKSQGINFAVINQAAIWLLILYVSSATFNAMQSIIMRNIAQNVSFSLRERVMAKINRLPMSYFDTTSVGETLSKVTNDVDLISQNLNQTLTQIISAITLLLGALVMMLSISLPMTFAAFLVIPMSGLIVRMIVKMSQKFFVEQQKKLGVVNGNIEEMYSGQDIIRAYCAEEKTLKEFERINQQLYESGWKSQFYSSVMMPALTFVGNLGYVIVAILGGIQAARGSIQVGDVLSFIQYTRGMNQPIGQTAQMANLLQATVAAADRVFELLEEEDVVDQCDKEMDDCVITLNHEGHIVFDHVSFGYNSSQRVIKDFSLDVKPGSTVAIVGRTGAGKTTIVKLLMGFYEVNGGSIQIDHVDIRRASKRELRNEFGVVLQDTWLFNGTIMENIRYANHNATDQQVVAAAKLAQADDFIRQLPNGYQMIINEEENNISEGQKQLLTIARAVLKDPAILILDEATSSVDTRTETLIQKAMNNLMKGRTNFVIAHRLSTIKNADVILVMDQGNIVEQGNHHELLDKGGLYAQLYNSQFDAS